MRPLGLIGVLLVVAGVIVLAMRGLSYTKDREEVRVGPVRVAAEEKGFIPPAAGVAAIVVGAILIFAARSKKV